MQYQIPYSSLYFSFSSLLSLLFFLFSSLSFLLFSFFSSLHLFLSTALPPSSLLPFGNNFFHLLLVIHYYIASEHQDTASQI